MSTGFYLQDHPNVTTAQYGWERAKIGQPGVHLSGAFGVHTTENLTDFFGPDYNAENVAHFISTRADHGGYHVVADADSIVLLVHPKYAAWADTTNNAHALSVSGSLQAARWLEMTPARRREVVVNMGKAAAQIALIAVRDGYLAQVPPARRISAQHAINGTAAGFYGHGETNPGTRYDPGAHFDWNLFLSSYASAVGGGITPQSTTPQEDTLSAAEVAEIKKHQTEQANRVIEYVGALVVSGYKVGDTKFPGTSKVDIVNQQTIRTILGLVKELAAGGSLTPEQIEAAVAKALAENTVDVDITVNGKPEVL